MNTTVQPSFLGRCWRAVRRIVFVFVAIIGLVTLFYVIENWRGRRAWKNYKAELTARGERMERTDYALAAVPAEQNFTETPVLRAISYRSNLDTNLLGKFEFVRKGLTNFPNGNELVRKEEAAEVLAQFRSIEAEMAELRTATKRPYAQFARTNDNSFLADVPYFITLRTLSQVFVIHASAELAAGHPDRALADITVVQRLADSLVGKATLVEAMIRVAILGVALHPFEEGLATGAWSDEQLLALQKSFESKELLKDLDVALRGGERNSLTHLMEDLPREELTDTLTSKNVVGMKEYFYRLAVRWCPRGWLYQNTTHYARVMQRQFDAYDVKQQRIFPAKCDAANAFILEDVEVRTPFNQLAAVGIPNFVKCTQHTAERQSQLWGTALACALERCRRAHGEYPTTLAVLVPQFIASLPTDLMTGEGLKYERTADGKFHLYSVGWNLQDDGGTRTKDLAAGDWVWPPARQ